MPAISSKAPGKTILFGEHAVVYGNPAIAVPIQAVYVKAIIQPAIATGLSTICFRERGTEKTIPFDELSDSHPIRTVSSQLKALTGQHLPPFSLTIVSTIPIAAGLGSSAAVAVAAARSMSQFTGKRLTDVEINQIAFQSEIIQHGNPSGIDNSVISFEKPIFFIKGKPIETLRIKKTIHLIVADSGERTLTRDVVRSVRRAMEANPAKIERIFSAINFISRHAKLALEKGNLKTIGKLMNQNHFQLQGLNVSTQKLDQLVAMATEYGAYGAKLCGGGKGGFMVAVCDEENQGRIADQLESFSPRVIKTVIMKDA